ncbi:sorting nexin-16 [Episyrphus balteatus]|uniref:sorting nexin-16 n=1 Tax=Episyrphus balteatus TaxID=286459 RepID=UPI00248598CB|nr:sorting nexin-16 [Episyrphus balteatus]
MSLRAIKKRDSSKPYKKYLPGSRPRKFSPESQPELRKLSRSYPDISRPEDTGHPLYSSRLSSKSDGDVQKLAASFKGNTNLLGAKSEVCLKTISVHNTVHNNTRGGVGVSSAGRNDTMPLQGAHSDRYLSRSNYAESRATSTSQNSISLNETRRRMSECSISNRFGRSVASSEFGERTGFTDTSAVRIPIIGYEVMEERARFTVYKLRVENPFTNDCWLVLRRYTDFVRLNNKLKQAFPTLTLHLPRKKIFGDNFNSVFLDNRVQGLQMFVNSIMSKEELRKFKLVREFFCLDEPPTYSESMEECRAIFEAQEETIAHLKMQISSKNDLILSAQQKLSAALSENEQLRESLKKISIGCPKCTPNGSATNQLPRASQ